MILILALISQLAWGQATPFNASYRPSVYVKGASSSKTPGASNRYLDMTGNSFTLNKGIFRLKGICTFRSPTVNAAFTTVGCGWYGSDGADNASAPTNDLEDVVQTVLTSNFTGAEALHYNRISALADITFMADEPIVRCASSCTIFLVPYEELSGTAGNARVIVYY